MACPIAGYSPGHRRKPNSGPSKSISSPDETDLKHKTAILIGQSTTELVPCKSFFA